MPILLKCWYTNLHSNNYSIFNRFTIYISHPIASTVTALAPDHNHHIQSCENINLSHKNTEKEFEVLLGKGHNISSVCCHFFKRCDYTTSSVAGVFCGLVSFMARVMDILTRMYVLAPLGIKTNPYVPSFVFLNILWKCDYHKLLQRTKVAAGIWN